MSESVRPGNTEVTRSDGSSARSESANARSANLLAEYEAMPADTLRPAPELMNTTCPRAARNAGSNASVSATAPVTFTSNDARHSSAVDSPTRPGNSTPALCTSTSSSASTSVLDSIESASVRSSGQVGAPRRSATSSSRADGRPASNRVWVGARAAAMAEPMAPLAPVISAVGTPTSLPTCNFGPGVA